MDVEILPVTGLFRDLFFVWFKIERSVFLGFGQFASAINHKFFDTFQTVSDGDVMIRTKIYPLFLFYWMIVSDLWCVPSTKWYLGRDKNFILSFCVRFGTWGLRDWTIFASRDWRDIDHPWSLGVEYIS